MADFHNQINSVGQLYQAENMTFGGIPASKDELLRQIEDLKALLAQAEDLPESTRAPVSQALAEAAAIPVDAPDAKNQIVDRLDGARDFLKAATGLATQTAPLIGAIGAVIGAVSGFVS